MIQSPAPSLSADLSKVAGKAHGASPKAAGAGSFSAILEDAGTATPPTSDTSAVTGDEAALLAASVAGGKPGKASGKILPVATDDQPAEVKSDVEGDAEGDAKRGTDAISPDAPTPVDIPLALATILPFAVPADPAPAVTSSPKTATADLASQAPTQSRLSTLPATATATAKGLANSSASERALALHGLLLQPGTPAATMPDVVAPEATGTEPTLPNGASSPTPALPAQAVPAADPAIAATKLAPIEVLADAAPATAAQLEARSPRAVQATQAAPKAESLPAAPNATATPVQAAAASAQFQADGDAPQSEADSQQRPTHVADTTEALDQIPAITRPSTPAAASPLPAVTDPAPIQHTGSIQPKAAIEAPQDFGTLVARLAEAREAANPQVVRTAVNHAEFGQISLEFRHKDDGLAVTMASRDPGFAGSVQAAAAASLANNTNGSGNSNDSARQQQQQHNAPFAQQQATSSGAGAGAGGGAQNQQARADQAGQAINRGSGTASRAQDQEASAPRQRRDGTRNGGGVYA